MGKMQNEIPIIEKDLADDYYKEIEAWKKYGIRYLIIIKI